ncbi:hypothetical protein [Aquabacterium humicola]|uniref:hypothetical protein n=1 Tax=Aquabacterium humicola TaxID=3237377 RepID=UPI002542D35B|nr:hypothetical protein [Rubrivivax pictus]
MLKNSLLAITFAVASGAVLAAEVRIPMPGNESLVFTAPDDWRVQTRPTLPGQPHTARITATDARQFQLLVTGLLRTRTDLPLPTDASVREAVRQVAAQAAPKAVEPALEVIKLDVPEAFAHYFAATDKAPGPDEYRYLLQGQLAIRDLTVVFTALMNDDHAASTAKTLQLLKSMRRTQAAATARTAEAVRPIPRLVPGETAAAADGYYVALPPLSQAVTYRLIVE